MFRLARGREKIVRCEKCGREVRKDKALFIEKAVFNNPLERKDVYSETYNRVLTREVSYCVSCGKHARLFQKKKQQQERLKERERMGRFQKHGPFYGGSSSRNRSYSSYAQSQPPAATAPPTPAQQASSSQAAETAEPAAEAEAETGEVQQS